MGTSLSGLLPQDTYQGLIKVGDNTAITSTLKTLSDGAGNNLPMQASSTGINFTGTTSGLVSGVSGAIQFSNGSAFASDAANLFWDDTNNRLGIGTTTPLGILHLKVAANTTRMVMDGDAGQSKIITYRTAGLQRFGLYVNNTAESGSNAGSDFAIRAYNDAGTLITTALFIKRSTGFLGVGNVTAPTQQLHVNGSLRIETGGIYDGTNSIGTSGQVLSSTGTSTAWITPSGGGGTPAGSTGAVQFNNAGAFGADSANFFWDNTNDRLGINTNAPTTALQVNYSSASLDGILVNQTGGTGNFSTIGFANNGNVRATLGMNLNTGEFRMSGLSGGYFPTFYANGVEAMRIDTSRNVGIGINAPTARLQVRGSGATSATTSLLVQNSAGTQTFKVQDDGDLFFSGLETSPMRIHTQGNLNKGITVDNEIDIGAFSGITFKVWDTSAYSNFMRIVGNTANRALVIGGTTNDASAILQIDSTSKGFLPPRMTTTQKNAIASPATGLVLYDSTTNKLQCYNGSTWNDLF